ncbi:MAG TPA: HNH endonuclease signature motif containing protein [Steroidobacteraceae bacterium]
MNERFWWVNHSDACRWERTGEYLWFAKHSHGSVRHESAKNVLRVLPGDVFFSFTGDVIDAIGVVLGTARDAARPAELHADTPHDSAGSGWLLPVRFMALERPFRPEAHCAEMTANLPRQSGNGPFGAERNPRVQLSAVPQRIVDTLRELLSGEIERIVETIVEAVGQRLADDAAEELLQRRSDLSPLQRSDLLKARHGKGPFRDQLESLEQACRITRLLDRRHLKAVHIKPWHRCADREMLDGNNGLLMSPHVGDLFVRGYLSFADHGEMLISRELNPAVLASWALPVPFCAGTFNADQCRYLDFHRREVFERHPQGRRRKGDPRTADIEIAAPEPAPAATANVAILRTT